MQVIVKSCFKLTTDFWPAARILGGYSSSRLNRIDHCITCYQLVLYSERDGSIYAIMPYVFQFIGWLAIHVRLNVASDPSVIYTVHVTTNEGVQSSWLFYGLRHYGCLNKENVRVKRFFMPPPPPTLCFVCIYPGIIVLYDGQNYNQTNTYAGCYNNCIQ